MIVIAWPWCDSPARACDGPGLAVDLAPIGAMYAGQGTVWVRLVSRNGPGLWLRWVSAWEWLTYSSRRRAWLLGPVAIKRLRCRWLR